MVKNIKRGQVWFYKPAVVSSGSIQRGPRPVIIVSNDILNKTSSVVLGIPCTTQIKRNFATHALFIMHNRVSVALAEQIMPVNVNELTTLEYILEDYVMKQIDDALMATLFANSPSSGGSQNALPIPSEVVDNSVNTVNKNPVGTQTAKFYSKYPQLAPQRSGKVRWTKQNAEQLVKDIESVAGRDVLEKKYGLSYETLRRYYYRFRHGGK